jgi:hypothetical protein
MNQLGRAAEPFSAEDFDAIPLPPKAKRYCETGCGTVLNSYNKSGLCGACARKQLDQETALDGMRCAREEKEERRSRPRENDVITKIQDVTENALRENKVAMSPGPATSTEKEGTSMDERKCAATGCEETLTERNKSGYCTRHIYMKYSTKAKPSGAVASKPRPPRKTAAKAAPEPTQAAKPESAIATLCFSEAQLVRMFTTLPLDEKVFCIQTYLEAAR